MDRYLAPHHHTPSHARSRFRMWLDFFLHGSRLYDKKTGLSTCSFCNARISIPAEYGKTMPLWAHCYSQGTYFLFFLFLRFLRDHTEWDNVWIIMVGLVCAACFWLLVRRYNKARALNHYSWTVVPDTLPDDKFIEEVKADNRRIRNAESLGFLAAIIAIRIVRLIFD